MDFRKTPEQKEFQQELQHWLKENLPDGWLEGERNIPEEGDPEREDFLRNWQRTLYEGGWAGIQWPEEYGGQGASLMEAEIYQEEMARVDSPPQINMLGITLVGPTIMQLGTKEQKERFIPNILNGEDVWCQGYSEPDSGSDIASLTTRAELDEANEEWIINGQKVWTSYAHQADWCILMTRTDSSGKKHEGITSFLVDMDQEGVDPNPIHQISDDRDFNEVYFDDAVVPNEDLYIVGEVDQGWDVIRTLSSFEHGMTRIYEIERRFETIRDYCQSQIRNGSRLIEDPHIRRQLARFETRIKAAKFTHYRHVREHMESGIPGPEGSIDLVVSDELSNDLENFVVSVTGPEASLWEDGPDDGRWVHDYLLSYGLWIAAGTGDIQRNIIGEQILGLPKDIKSETSHKE